MAAPINLSILDTLDIDQTEFGPDSKRWLSNIIDTINAAFTTILIAVGQKDVGGGGAGPITVAVTGINANNFVNVTLLSSTNATTIIDVTPGANQFTVTFQSNPGASAIIAYQVFTQNIT